MLKYFSFLTTMLFTSVAFAQEVPDAPNEFVTAISAAYKSGNWHLLVSAILMALVWVVVKVPFIADRITGKAKVWLVASLGIVSSVATTAFISNGDWGQAVLNGLSVGLGASGLFELIRRTVSKEPIDADDDGVLDEK